MEKTYIVVVLIIGALTIIAIIAGPILAVQAQKWIEKLTRRKELKRSIFQVLMTTRGTPLDPDRIKALNMIDIAFSAKSEKDKKVRDAWRLYFDQLHDVPRDYQAPDYKTKMDNWNTRSSDVGIDMLHVMAQALNYDFDKVLIKRGAYVPEAHGFDQLSKLFLRDSLANLFLGKASLPIRIVEEPTEEVKPEAIKKPDTQEKPEKEANSH